MASLAWGEQLPLRNYTTVHGLAGNSVHRIRNVRGLLWFATTEGLSRFDGVSFTNYGTAQGLPHSDVRDFLATTGGAYWVATEGGLCRYDPKPQPGKPKFTPYPLGGASRQRAYVLLEDGPGAVWCGTDRGLYRLEPGGSEFRPVDLGPRQEAWALPQVEALFPGRRGTVWIGSGSGLFRVRADGKLDRFTIGNGLPRDEILAIAEDRDGALWVGTDLGLTRLVSNPSPDGQIVDRHYSRKDGLPDEYVQSLFLHSSGRLWAGTLNGFVEVGQPGKAALRTFTSDHGLSNTNVEALAEDPAGNMWIGAYGGGGAMKFSLQGITNYTKSDGLGSLPVISILESRRGDLCAVTRDAANLHLNCFDGTRFQAIRPGFPPSIESFGGGWNQVALQDRSGEWWFATGSGLVRFPPAPAPVQLAAARPQAIYTRLDQQASEHVYRIFEDSGGAVWGAGSSKSRNAVFRVRSGRLEQFSEQDGLPSLKDNRVVAIAEDRAGQIWLGYHSTGLVRYRQGRFERIAGLPPGGVRFLLADSGGRLWAAAEAAGLARLDRPEADRSAWTFYTTAEGLSSNRIHSLVEDRLGRIYVGTGHGVDRLDPSSGRIHHYTTADGLLDGEVSSAYRDRQGALWFGTHKGLSRLAPQPDRSSPAPEVFLTGLRVSGNLYPVSDLGETSVRQLELSSGSNALEVEFGGRDFTPGGRLRYQHKLEGAGNDWNAPSELRSLHLASLSPGSYRLLLRAVGVDGQAGGPGASIEFAVAPPVWRRWWFLLLSVTALAGIAYATHRYHVAQAVALERMRTRIAADLHDDIGSSLSHIAILSELAGQRVEPQQEAVRGPLAEIEHVSRELVDSMSDIVWAIDPRKDHVRDLAQRMRRWASDVLTGRSIEFTFHAPAEDLVVDAEVRREIFLVFKEAVHNVVRHSGCTEAAIDLRREEDSLVLQVADNGKGFASDQVTSGQGLASIQRRASRLGGEARIHSNGKGASVYLRVPLRGATRRLKPT